MKSAQLPDWEDVPELAERLADEWRQGNLHAFYALILDEMKPRLTRFLMSRTDLDYDEIEDCISIGIGNFEEKQSDSRSQIRNPYNYLFTTVRNAATDALRQRDADLNVRQIVSDTSGREPGGRVLTSRQDELDAIEVDDDDETDSSDPIVGPEEKPSSKWATAIVEETVFGIEVEVDWAVPVMELAISKLPGQQRKVIRHLASEDFDFLTGDFNYRSTAAAKDLGMSPAAFRKNKERAYKALKTLIPESIRFLGVIPNPHVAESIFEGPARPIPSEEDE